MHKLNIYKIIALMKTCHSSSTPQLKQRSLIKSNNGQQTITVVGTERKAIISSISLGK